MLERLLLSSGHGSPNIQALLLPPSPPPSALGNGNVHAILDRRPVRMQLIGESAELERAVRINVQTFGTRSDKREVRQQRSE